VLIQEGNGEGSASPTLNPAGRSFNLGKTGR
jgi:hypothetical protein